MHLGINLQNVDLPFVFPQVKTICGKQLKRDGSIFERKVTLIDGLEEADNLLLVEYRGQPDDVSPHGNSKKGQPYTRWASLANEGEQQFSCCLDNLCFCRMSLATRQRITALSEHHSPMDTYSQVMAEEGVDSTLSNVGQVKYVRSQALAEGARRHTSARRTKNFATQIQEVH